MRICSTRADAVYCHGVRVSMSTACVLPAPPPSLLCAHRYSIECLVKLIAPPQVNSVKLCGEALEHGAGTAISDVLQETSTADGVIFLQARCFSRPLYLSTSPSLPLSLSHSLPLSHSL
jgi:hypothetical protein